MLRYINAIANLIRRGRAARWANVVIANLRILIGFAFVPAGLKKLLAQPFTDPQNTGPFHEFLHAFHATGWFYQFVGVMQLTAAVLLCSQRFATLGALLALPMLAAIMVFCWSTAVYPTAVVVTLMFCATTALLLWDVQKWRGVFAADDRETHIDIVMLPPVIDLRLWRRCGLAILAIYFGVCAASGGIYRPKGFEPGNPAFYVFPAIMVLPIITFVIDQRRYRAGQRESASRRAR